MFDQMGIFIVDNTNIEKPNSNKLDSNIKSESKSLNNNISNTKQTQTILRCPKCRSINPPKATYCINCGLVFKSSSNDNETD